MILTCVLLRKMLDNRRSRWSENKFILPVKPKLADRTIENFDVAPLLFGTFDLVFAFDPKLSALLQNALCLDHPLPIQFNHIFVIQAACSGLVLIARLAENRSGIVCIGRINHDDIKEAVFVWQVRNAVYTGIDRVFHEQEMALYLRDDTKECFLAVTNKGQEALNFQLPSCGDFDSLIASLIASATPTGRLGNTSKAFEARTTVGFFSPSIK